MLGIFMYPVSGIMKLWHILLHSVFGINDSLAWVLSIFGLIIVVRGLITPAQWYILHSGRLTVMMRPEITALHAEYRHETSFDKISERDKRERDIRKAYGYRTSAGCIPPLIQIPAFLGLYQVLLRMARPKNGLDSQTHDPIGVLSSADVSSFLHARFGNIPVSVYVSMSPEQFAHLGTNYDDVLHFVFPLLLATALITFINMSVTVVRNYLTIDNESKTAVVLTRVIFVATLLTPFLLVSGGMNGPVPAAIATYWVANNLWTLVQNFSIYLILHRKLPLSKELLDFQREQRRKRIRKVRTKRAHRWKRALSAVSIIVTPWLHHSHRAHWAESTAYLKEARANQKAEKKRQKEISVQRRKARSEHLRIRAEQAIIENRQKKAARKAKDQKDQME